MNTLKITKFVFSNMINRVEEALEDPESFGRVSGVPGMKSLRSAVSKQGFSSLAVHENHLVPPQAFLIEFLCAGPWALGF